MNDKTTEITLPWTTNLPKSEGRYLFAVDGDWFWKIAYVSKGKIAWGQKESDFYVTDSKRVEQMGIGKWCGPLANPQ